MTLSEMSSHPRISPWLRGFAAPLVSDGANVHPRRGRVSWRVVSPDASEIHGFSEVPDPSARVAGPGRRPGRADPDARDLPAAARRHARAGLAPAAHRRAPRPGTRRAIRRPDRHGDRDL